MANERIGTAVLELRTDNAAFDRGLGDAEKRIQGTGETFKSLARDLAGLFSLRDITAGIANMVDATGEISDAAQRIGISAEAVQRLQFAAEQSGASLETVATAIGRMSDGLTGGDKAVVTALTTMGLTLADLQAMTPDQAFTAIAEAIRKIPDPMQQASFAMDIFGRGGQQLLPAIKAGLIEVGNAAPVMSNAVVQAGDDMGDSWDQTQIRINALKANALIPLLDTFTAMPSSVQTAVGGIAAFTPSLETLVLAIVGAGGPVAAFGAVKAAIMGVIPFLTTALPAALAVITGPIGLTVAAIAGLTVVWATWGDDITRIVRETYEEVKAWLVDAWDGSIFQSLARMLEAMGRLFGALATVAIEKVTELYNGVKTWILDKLQPVIEAVQPILQAVGRYFTLAKDAVIGTVTALYNGVKTWLVDRFAAIVNGIKEKIDAVTGFFNNMYDKVVGNSYVPDMIDRIEEEFNRLPSAMVAPTENATGLVTGAFGGMQRDVTGLLQAFVGETDGTFMGQMKGIFSSFTGGPLSQLSSQLGDAFGPKVGAAIDKFKGFMSDGFTAVTGIARAFAGDFSGLVDGIMAGIRAISTAWDAISGLFKSEETKKVNKPRDQFFNQYGGFEGLAGKLGEKVDGSTAERLIATLYAADTEQKFHEAEDAIIALVGGRKFGLGGFVSGPTLGMVGESGPEVIYPLDRFERMLGLDGRAGRGQEIRVALNVDGITLAEQMVRHMPRALSHAGLV